MDFGLKGKVAVVTGASSGIGAATCKVLAGEGCNVVINYAHSKEKAEAVAEACKSFGVDAICVKADFSKEEEIKALFEEVMAHYGTVDILMNNAVNSHNRETRCDFENFATQDLLNMEKTVIEGTFVATREFIKILKSQNKGGKIVNVLTKGMFWSSSIRNEIYASCKGAISAFTRAIAHEYGMENIYCNAIIPGYVRNDRTNVESERYQKVIKFLPLKRYAEPEEMGYTVAFLCSDKALQINGATIDLTGGTLVGDYVEKETFKFL